MNPHTNLLEHVLVPVANPDDANVTAPALAAFDPDHVTVLYVIERPEGAIDPIPSEYFTEEGEQALEAFRNLVPGIDERLTFGENLVETIFDVATEIDASAIAYRSRGGSRFVRFLSGDHALKLVADPPLPVIALPDPKRLGAP